MFKPHILRSVTLLSAIFIATAGAQDTKENSEFKLAVNLYNSRMYDLAADQFQNFINAYSGTANTIEARFYLGLTQMKLQRHEEARITFQNFALTYTDNPKAPEAWMHVGDAYAALKNNREAASAYERVKIFHPKSPLAAEALLKAAQFYRASGASENARKALRTITQDYATSSSVPAARLAIGEFHLEEGRPELAESEFSRVMESSAEPSLKARATLLLAKSYLASARIEEAEGLFKRITTMYKSTPSYAAATFELGLYQQQSGKYPEAIESLKRAYADSLAEQQLREQALAEIGNCYAASSDFTNALKQYEQFVSSFPRSKLTARVLFDAGRAAGAAKKHQTALGYFLKILATPALPEATKESELYTRKALVGAAESAVKLNDYTKAIQWYRTFLDKYPADPVIPEVLMRIGNLYEDRLKDFRRAAGYYEDVSVKFPRSHLIDDALLAIGRCRESSGDTEGALAVYGEVIERYPSSDHTPKANERIEFLRNHKAKNRDVGLQKLALLVGEMLSNRSKGSLAFKLGEIYFHDLKDYRSAAQQFTAAIEGGMDEENLADAYFYRARSFHLLSELEPEAAGQATTGYDAFLQQFPAGKLSDDAALYSLQLKSKGKPAAEVVASVREFLAKRPTSLWRPNILMILAEAQETSGEVQNAINTYSVVTKDFGNAPIAEKAWLHIGRLYAQREAADSAARAFNNAALKFPRGTHTAEALWLLANTLMDQQKPTEGSVHRKEAIELLQRLTSDHFYTSYALRAESALGEMYAETERFDDALALFQSIADRDQSSPFVHESNYQITFKLAAVHNRKGDKLKAAELYRAYLTRDRKSALAGDAYFALGVIARDQGKTESASAYFRQAAALSGSGESNREIAELLFQTEQYPEAERQFVQLAKSVKNEPEKQYYESRIIVCKLRRNDFKGAEPAIKAFVKAYKKSAELLAELEYEKGLYHFRKQEYPIASKTFANVADDYDKTKYAARSEYYVGKILEVTNKVQDAVKKYESVLKRYAKSDVISRVYLSLGNISYNAEKYQDAIRNYQRIVESSETAIPDGEEDILPYAMNNLIDAYEAMQVYDAALQVTRNFIERFPNDPGIMDKRINIGVLYIRLGYHDQAIVHLQNLLDEAGSDLEAEIRYAIGEAYYYKGDYQQAILEFLKVPYLVTKQGKVDWTATSFYMAGQAYEKMSRFDQAIAMYRQIIDRPGIDGTFKAAAKKEIDRVKTITKGSK